MNIKLATETIDHHQDISCANCEACCCQLEVLLMADDDVPAHLSQEDRWGGWVMRRLGDGWCAALDRNSMRCTIYQRRPFICRDFAMGASECLEERRLLAGGQIYPHQALTEAVDR